MKSISQLTEKIIGVAVEVHREKRAGSVLFRETGHVVGLLINFHVPRSVDGLTRIVNDRVSL